MKERLSSNTLSYPNLALNGFAFLQGSLVGECMSSAQTCDEPKELAKTFGLSAVSRRDRTLGRDAEGLHSTSKAQGYSCLTWPRSRKMELGFRPLLLR